MPQVLIVISINGPEERFQIVVLTSCTSVTIIFLPSGPFLLSAVCNCYNGNDNYPQCIIITQTRHTFDTLIIYWIIMAQMRPYPFLYSFTQWWGLRMSYFCVRTCVNFPYLCLLFQTAPYNNFIYVLINSALLVENIHYIIKQSHYYGVLNHPCQWWKWSCTFQFVYRHGLMDADTQEQTGTDKAFPLPGLVPFTDTGTKTRVLRYRQV